MDNIGYSTGIVDGLVAKTSIDSLGKLSIQFIV